MYDDSALYPPPPPPPPEPTQSRPVLGGVGKVLLATGLLFGAGVGGFVIAQAASAPSASTLSQPNTFAAAQQAATTPAPSAAPNHRCPNMGGGSSGSSNSGASTTVFMP